MLAGNGAVDALFNILLYQTFRCILDELNAPTVASVSCSVNIAKDGGIILVKIIINFDKCHVPLGDSQQALLTENSQKVVMSLLQQPLPQVAEPLDL